MDTDQRSGKRRVAACPAEVTLQVLGGRWKTVILWRLFSGTRRFSELRRAVGGITQKMLTEQLRELEAEGVVRCHVYPEVPPNVEYSVTALGASLRPVVAAMCQGGAQRRTPSLRS